MFLEIVSPEATLFSKEVTAVTVPGVNGSFQMLENHASIVSVLQEGVVKIQFDAAEKASTTDLDKAFTANSDDNKSILLNIKSGTVEMLNNKVIVLVD